MIVLFDGHTSTKQGASGTLDGVTVTENYLVSTIFNPILHLSMIQQGIPAHHIGTASLEVFDPSAKNGGSIRKKAVLANAMGADIALDVHLNAATDHSVGGIWMCYDNDASARAINFCDMVINALHKKLWPKRRTYLLAEDRDGFAEQCGQTDCDGIVIELEFISNEPAMKELLEKRLAKLDNLGRVINDAYVACYLEGVA